MTLGDRRTDPEKMFLSSSFVYFVSYMICIFLLIWLIIKYYLEHGYYVVISKRFGIRRYVFPKDAKIQNKIAADMTKICRTVMDGIILPYPFLQNNPAALANRVVCFFYDRTNPKQEPVAFHAPFITVYENKTIYHVGLVMVKPEYQHQGMQTLGAWNAILFFLFHGFNVIGTDIGSSSSYLTVMEKTQKDYFPDWTKPESKPKLWQVKVARHMLNKYREDFGCSSNGEFDEETFVIKGGHSKGACDGAAALTNMYTTRQSKDLRKQVFISDRLDNTNGDLQFFVGKPDFLKLFTKIVLKR